MQKKLLLSVIILLSAAGILTDCIRTTGQLKIKGRVVDAYSKEVIPYRSIFLRARENGNENSSWTDNGQFVTDSSGIFNFTMRKVKGIRYYSFDISGDTNYYYSSRFVGLWELEQNAKFLTFPMQKLTTLKINIHRSSTKPLRDTIRLIWQSDGVFGWSLYQYRIFDNDKGTSSVGQRKNSDLIFIGGKVNSTIDTKVFAEKKTELTWELYRYGKRLIYTDTLTCKRDVVNIANFSY